MDSIDLLARHVATTNRFDRSARVNEREREGERSTRAYQLVGTKRLSSMFARVRCEKYVVSGSGATNRNVFFHRAIRTDAENGGGRKTTATIAQFRVNLIGKRRSIRQGTNQTANRTRCNGY